MGSTYLGPGYSKRPTALYLHDDQQQHSQKKNRNGSLLKVEIFCSNKYISWT